MFLNIFHDEYHIFPQSKFYHFLKMAMYNPDAKFKKALMNFFVETSKAHDLFFK